MYKDHQIEWNETKAMDRAEQTHAECGKDVTIKSNLVNILIEF